MGRNVNAESYTRTHTQKVISSRCTTIKMFTWKSSPWRLTVYCHEPLLWQLVCAALKKSFNNNKKGTRNVRMFWKINIQLYYVEVMTYKMCRWAPGHTLWLWLNKRHTKYAYSLNHLLKRQFACFKAKLIDFYVVKVAPTNRKMVSKWGKKKKLYKKVARCCANLKRACYTKCTQP